MAANAIPELVGQRKIVIIRLGSIGDVLHASPVAREIKNHFPDSRISWVVETKSKDVIEGNSNLEQVFVWRRKEWNAEAKKTRNYYTLIKRNLDFLAQIRQQNFDIAIDLHGMYRSGLISYASNAKYRICVPNPLERSTIFANICIKDGSFPTVYDKYLSVLKCFGIQACEPTMEMPVTADDKVFAQDFMAEYALQPRRYIAFNPSTSCISKCWPVDKFAQLGDWLHAEYGLPIIIFGAAGDKAMTQAIIARMKNRPVDATGTMTLKQVGAVAQQAAVFISGDTGPLYIAQALDVPTVALYGVTNAQYYTIPKQNRISIQANENSLSNITVEEVFGAVKKLVVGNAI